MMEKLGAPQTHLGLKNMIKEVDEDLDNKLSFREVREDPRSMVYGSSCIRAEQRQLVLIFCPVPADLQEGGSRRAGRGQWTVCPRSAL